MTVNGDDDACANAAENDDHVGGGSGVGEVAVWVRYWCG